MKQKEKTRLTRIRIMNAAIAEYGSKGYHGGSINAICSENNISKGLIYHNYKNKDDLYLEAVRYCYQQLTDYVLARSTCQGDLMERTYEKLHLRQEFFQANPCYSNLFFSSLLEPPANLRQQLSDICKDFANASRASMIQQLRSMELRPGITPEIAAEYLFICREMFTAYFQNQVYEEEEFRSVVEKHDARFARMMDIILYGIAKNKD